MNNSEFDVPIYMMTGSSRKTSFHQYEYALFKFCLFIGNSQCFTVVKDLTVSTIWLLVNLFFFIMFDILKLLAFSYFQLRK